jgi:UDP-N-acetylmuramoyl-L-alanyl-D-glutamate--2,6-diaminopimelate ligase
MIRRARLADVAARLADAGLLATRPVAGLDTELRGVADDSRAVAAGDLFCAWAGVAQDGHAHAPAAVRAGAVALLVERPLPDVSIPQLVVSDGRRAAAVAAALLLGNPQESLGLVGVTGTNGKTTTVWILRYLLSARGGTASLGTLGAVRPDGSVIPGSEALTTPGPVQLARTLRQLADAGATRIAMEMSSHALDQGRVAALRFDAAVFTNLTRDHLDYHGTVERYLAAKRRLLGMLRPGGAAVINADDPAWAGLSEAAPRALTFGTCRSADLRISDVRLDAAGASFTLATAAGATPAHIPLLGEFNVQNAAAAGAACLALGFELTEVIAALAGVPQVPGRLERIASEPCPVLRDYAHTPDALERALAALRPLTAGRLIVVFGAGGDRDRGKRPLMGKVAAGGADVVIVTSDNPRTEDPEAIIDEIMAGIVEGQAARVVNRRAAIADALALATPADLVLLAGKGHETYQVIGTEKRPFDERVIVQQLLSGAGEAEA